MQNKGQSGRIKNREKTPKNEGTVALGKAGKVKGEKREETGKKLPVLVLPECVGDVFQVVVLGFGGGLVFFLDAIVDFLTIHRNAFRRLNTELYVPAVELDDLDDDVVADPYRFA
jgi:hypothetical protein